jgi:DNA polymerase III epsilon subunit-like protein
MSYTFIPALEDIIFFDTEFSSNDPVTGEILSLALIKSSGEELYLEIDYSGPLSEFVQDRVLPYLTQNKVTKEIAKELIIKFVGEKKLTLVTFVNQFDFVYLTKIIPYQELPFTSIPIDFASILFAIGIDPNDYKENSGYKLMKNLQIDTTLFKPHFALDDTRLLKEVYLKLKKNSTL